MTGTAVELLPCPFCGSANIELNNTWTPSFWCECQDCGAQAHGESFDSEEYPQRDDKWSYDPNASPNQKYAVRTLEELHPEYQQAALDAIDAWNQRC